MKEWLQKFLEKEPPYKVVNITSNQLQQIFDIENITITQYCERCKQQRSFKCHSTEFQNMSKEYMQYVISSNIDYDIEDYGEQCCWTFLLKFNCQHDCGESHYIILLIKQLTLQKIGQYPTFAKEEANKKLTKYKSLIPKYYPELTKAVSAYSQNMGVPAFLYLRRILEHLVEEKHKNYGGSEGIKFVDKLHKVEQHEKIIPDEFNEIKNQLYTVLSKGVHEYEEKECIDMFPAVKFIIEIILDEELMKKERTQKAQEAKAIIQKKLKKGDE